MLVLSRKVKQRIVIGDNIELVVVSVVGDRVKLGFSAPEGVPIHREEIFRRIQSEERSETVSGSLAAEDRAHPPLHEPLAVGLDS